ncbi:MAG: hypothetical protein GX610_21020, partial [Rhodococcus sp.]|nr:hypothetical protein [Rhodococcus sp. (in: high G+C Gram-positive bacteria)]
MEPNRRDSDPGSKLGGRLLTLVDRQDSAGLSTTVTALVCTSTTEHAHYGQVLEWLVTSIAEVINDK